MTIIVAIFVFLLFLMLTALAMWGEIALWNRAADSEGFTAALYLVLCIACAGAGSIPMLMMFIAPVVILVVGAL